MISPEVQEQLVQYLQALAAVRQLEGQSGLKYSCFRKYNPHNAICVGSRTIPCRVCRGELEDLTTIVKEKGAMKVYQFTVRLWGEGEDEIEAWEQLLRDNRTLGEAFGFDFSLPEPRDIEVVEEWED